MADLNILDYSNTRLVTIHTGIARRQKGIFKIVHAINIDQYRNLLGNLESVLNNDIAYSHPIRPFLEQQTLEIRRLLKRLSPNKVKRSIDVIGTAWKWIAGTPDSHDFEILTQKMANLLENNNRQMVINELTINRIQEISNITNEILKVRKEDWNTELTISLERKLNLIEKELQNIEYAIQWAKVNIVNSFILSKTEIEAFNDVLTNYNIPIFNVDELLTFGNVKIVTNNKEILYILSIPITHTDNCETYLAKPVKCGNLIDKIEFDKILKCKDVLFAIKEKCKNYNDITICNKNDIVELRDDYCITNLFRNRIGNCTQVNNDHVATIEEIGSDLILLNQYNGKITTKDEEIKLNGTYLVKHFNTTIKIDEQEYFSLEVSASKPLPAFLQPKGIGGKIEEVLSLERLQKINIENIKRLSLLETKNNIMTIVLALVLIAAMGTIASVKMWRRFYHSKKGKEALPETIETPDEEPKAEKKQSSIYNLHVF